MLKAVIFDMDGVLIDSEILYLHALQRYLQDQGVTLAWRDLTWVVGMKLEDISAHIVKKYALNLTAEEVSRGQERYCDDLYQADLAVMEGLEDFLTELKSHGVKTAVASSSIKRDVDTVLRRFDLKQYFDAVVAGDMVERSKPAPDIFLRAAQLLKALPEECAVIEDSVSGIAAGKSAGMFVVGFKGSVVKQNTSAADMEVYRFNQLSRDILAARAGKQDTASRSH
ncbi:HAD family phosphatase [Bacteroides sp. OttesenSCG-928-J23]|nr:HAD family phosphatase [Bacteroides sp. OttesenSCG-928-J23]